MEGLDEPLADYDARLDSMFEVEDGSAGDSESGVIVLSTAQGGAAGDSESGNIVLRSAVDDTEEATNVVLLHWVRKSLRVVMKSCTQLEKLKFVLRRKLFG